MTTSLVVVLVLALAGFIVWKNMDRRTPEEKRADFDRLDAQAAAGQEEAQYKLLMLYYDEKDPLFHPLAFKWALKVAEKGEDPGVMLQTGEMYEHGEGTAKDLSAALTWYERALSADTALGARSPLSKDGHLYLESRIFALRRELHPEE